MGESEESGRLKSPLPAGAVNNAALTPMSATLTPHRGKGNQGGRHAPRLSVRNSWKQIGGKMEESNPFIIN